MDSHDLLGGGSGDQALGGNIYKCGFKKWCGRTPKTQKTGGRLYPSFSWTCGIGILWRTTLGRQ